MILRHLVWLAALLLLSPMAVGAAPPPSARPSTRPKRPEYVSHPAEDLVCRPFGECEPCPEDELSQPFCLPFGNRRLLHCIPASKQDDAYETDDRAQPPGEVPAWEACGKVVKAEERAFYEFVTANVLFLVVALAIYGIRTSTLATAQYRQLAARIGISGAGWRAA
ncbi:hypothetical protein Q5752_004999 [Cryptotrichosporon argae]